MLHNRKLLGYILVFPTIVIIATIAIIPLFKTFHYSFTNANLNFISELKYVGLNNYIKILSTPAFIKSIINTIYFTCISVSMELIIGLIIALFLNTSFKGRGFIRAVILIPWAIPTVVSSQMWKWMYNDVFGVVNDVLLRLTLIDSGIAWIGNVKTAMFAVILVDVWKTAPFMTLLLLAGLQTIPKQLYEAASVDGASKIRQYFFITLPLLKPTILIALIFRTLDSLRVFDVIYVLTNGAFNTESMATYNRRVLIEFQKLGEGSAISVVIFLVITLFILLYIKFIKDDIKK